LPRFRAEVSSRVKKVCAGVDGSYERYGSSYTVTFNLPEGVNERTYAVKLRVRDDEIEPAYSLISGNRPMQYLINRRSTFQTTYVFTGNPMVSLQIN
jgi:hypothetical protein